MYNPQLETFITVADSGSFNKAAEALYISPPAVIKQINLLENRLGVRLFTRSHQGLQLTKAGKSIYDDAKYVINYCNAAVERAKNAEKSEISVMRIGTSPMTPGQPVVDVWSKVRTSVPDIKFQLVPFENTPENAREILRNLGTNIDIVGGMYDEHALKTWQCEATYLFNIELQCAVSVYNPLAEKERLTLDDLKGKTLMIIRKGWNHVTDELREFIQNEHPEIKIETFDFINLGVFNRCENSDYLLISIETLANVHPLLKLIPVDWDFSIPFGLLHSPKPDETVGRFLKAVEDNL